MNCKTDTAELKRAKERRDNEEPRVEDSITESAKTEPKRDMPTTESAEPKRAYCRKESADPP